MALMMLMIAWVAFIWPTQIATYVSYHIRMCNWPVILSSYVFNPQDSRDSYVAIVSFTDKEIFLYTSCPLPYMTTLNTSMKYGERFS